MMVRTLQAGTEIRDENGALLCTVNTDIQWLDRLRAEYFDFPHGVRIPQNGEMMPEDIARALIRLEVE